MSEKLTHTLNNLEAFSLPSIRTMVALKQSILLLQVIIFFDVIEGIFVAAGNMV